MASSLARLWPLGLALAACREPPRPPAEPPRTPPSESDIVGAALAAVGAAPWDADPTGWGTLCTVEAPCDTVVVEPRVVMLPAQAPAFFVPAGGTGPRRSVRTRFRWRTSPGARLSSARGASAARGATLRGGLRVGWPAWRSA